MGGDGDHFGQVLRRAQRLGRAREEGGEDARVAAELGARLGLRRVAFEDGEAEGGRGAHFRGACRRRGTGAGGVEADVDEEK